MKINYFIVNPGGNITAIVRGKFTRKIKLRVSKKILGNNPTVEQVGFWTNAKNKKNDARLEMAGGEFCGNALRSLASILAQYNLKRLYLIESSGIKIAVKLNSSAKFSSLTLELNLFRYQNSVCSIPGIKHFLCKKTFSRLNAKKMLIKKGLLKNKAAGIISYRVINQNIYTINPIVYVKDTKTLYEETACASGALALAYMLYKKNGIKKLNIQQPSGFTLKTEIKNYQITLIGRIVSIRKEVLNI